VIFRVFTRRKGVVALVILLVFGAAAFFLIRDRTVPPVEVPGTPEWGVEHYGSPDARKFKKLNIVTIDFLGRTMFVHRDAQRHFLRLERLFEARAPEYAASVALGTFDDWSYQDRDIRGVAGRKSNHAFGIAIDINALTNVLGTSGDMPMEVVDQWLVEGGDWGGLWSRPDPMHFETHLTPEEIQARYNADGTPKAWYLEELVGG
jgi:hypothetical protein